MKKDQDVYYLVKVLTKKGEATIKSACKEKLSSYYLETEDTDLIARELKYHKPCFNTFTYDHSIQNKCQLDNSGLYNGKTAQSTYEQGDFQSFIDYINEHVKRKKETVSMTTFHTVYGIGVNDSRYRSKLKTIIKNQFGEDVIFCSVVRNSPDIVVSWSLSLSEVTFQDRDGCMIKAAEYLWYDIMSSFEKATDANWPPTVEDIEEESIPNSLALFQKYLLNALYSKKKTLLICK